MHVHQVGPDPVEHGAEPAAAAGDQVISAVADLGAQAAGEDSSFDVSWTWTSTPAWRSHSTSWSTDTFSPEGVAAEYRLRTTSTRR